MPRCSDSVASTLSAHGVERVFGIPGGETVHLVDSLESHDVPLIVTRHENSAAFMALTAARFDRRTGVCLTTIGPGAANIVLGAGTATLDFAPLLVMTGELPEHERSHPRKQRIDQAAVFEPVCKASLMASRHDAGEVTAEAMRIAAAERPGAVHLALPADVMAAEGGLTAPPAITSPFRVPELKKIMASISSSKKPLALIGAGAWRSDAVADVIRFVESNAVPALHTWQGNGTVPFDHPLSLHNVGLPCNRIPMQALEEADLVITIGYDEQEFQPSIWNRGCSKEVVHLSANPAQDVPFYRPAEAVGDLGAMLRRLSDLRHPSGNWATPYRDEVIEHIGCSPSNGQGVCPVDAVKALSRHVDDGVIVSDVGAHMLWLAEYMPCRRPNSLIISNGMIPMGIGLPGAMGIKFAHPEMNCITVTGDAGLMMCLGELQTSLEHDVPVTVLVWNDAALGLIDTRHRIALERPPAYRLERTDMAKVADSFGAEGVTVERPGDLPAALYEARGSDVTTVIDVRIDYSANRRLLV